VLGLLLGLNFISTGLAYIALARALKPSGQAHHARAA